MFAVPSNATRPLHGKRPFGQCEGSLRETQDGYLLVFLPQIKIELSSGFLKEHKLILPECIAHN